jgi:hypothetical protein
MKPRALLLSALLSTMTVTAVDSAKAYVVLKNWEGATYRWASPNITWTISTTVMDDVSFQALQGALNAAFATWENVGCSRLDFSYGGQKAQDPGNGIHFTFRSTSWDASVADALAYSQSEVRADGTITSNDVVFNAFDFEWTTNGALNRNDIQGVATHEIGHSFGLDHTRVREATMFFAGGDTELSSLDEDDIRGACFLYPTAPFTAGESCDECEEHSHCGVGTCFDWEIDGHAFCGNPCDADFNCEHGLTCFEIDGFDEPMCLPDNNFDGEIDECHVAGRDAGLGDYCYGDDMCASQQCLVWGDTAEQTYCTESCNPDNLASCGAGYACFPPGFCVKAGDEPNGSPCVRDDECLSAFCFFFVANEGTCTTLCDSREDCPQRGQCDQGQVCVPPGEAGIGTPCTSPHECRGTYCEDGLCTARCDGGCPAGTNCVDGFCAGSQAGLACGAQDRCPDGLICTGDKTCQKTCDALTDTGCGDGEVCSWRMQGTRVSGLCVPATGGRKVGDSCASEPCEVDLLCQKVDGFEVCARDCRVDSGFGCLDGEQCIELVPDVERDGPRGVCVPEPAQPPPDEDTSSPSLPDGDVAPGTDVTTPSAKKDEGCTGGAPGTTWFIALMWGLIIYRARRLSRDRLVCRLTNYE